MGWYHAFFIGECRVNAGGGRVFSSWLRCAPLFKLLHDSGCGASSGHPFQWISFFLLGFVFLSFWLHSAVVHIISPVGWNLCPLQWEPRLLTTGPPGEFSFRIFFFLLVQWISVASQWAASQRVPLATACGTSLNLSIIQRHRLSNKILICLVEGGCLPSLFLFGHSLSVMNTVAVPYICYSCILCGSFFISWEL